MLEPEPLVVTAVRWPEVRPGDDLGVLLAAVTDLRDGDVVVVTSKVVAKAEGRAVPLDRSDLVAEETVRVVARRGPTVIAETRHGFVMAAAGVDASNTEPGTVVPLPLDPDASARRLREAVYGSRRVNLAVVVSDTAGRAWREGQTDLAVGCAGLHPLTDLRGSLDTHGNELVVTTPAIADEAAAAADLVKGKTTGCPMAVLRGLRRHVLPPGEHGPGASALVRPAAGDLFGLGSREAVATALHRTDLIGLGHFPQRVAGDRDPFEGLLESWLAAPQDADPAAGDAVAMGQEVTLDRGGCVDAPAGPTWTLRAAVPDDASADQLIAVGRLLERADALAASQRLSWHDHPLTARSGWRAIAARCWWDS